MTMNRVLHVVGSSHYGVVTRHHVVVVRIAKSVFHCRPYLAASDGIGILVGLAPNAGSASASDIKARTTNLVFIMACLLVSDVLPGMSNRTGPFQNTRKIILQNFLPLRKITLAADQIAFNPDSELRLQAHTTVAKSVIRDLQTITCLANGIQRIASSAVQSPEHYPLRNAPKTHQNCSFPSPNARFLHAAPPISHCVKLIFLTTSQ